MELNLEKLGMTELSTEMQRNLVAGESLWKWVGMYVGLVSKGMDSTTAAIATGFAAYYS